MRSRLRGAGCARSLIPVAAAILALSGTPASGQQTTTFDSLLEKLKDKGVLSQEEFEALKGARDEEIQEQRAERRRQALRQAQEAEQKEKVKDTEAKATKFDVSPGVRSMQLFGDVRVRYESRSGDQDAQFGQPAKEQTRDRWRYAVRIGIRGELVDAWYYGLRLETASSNRSTWITFGGDTQNAAGNNGPSAKNDDTINVGWAYLGWRPTKWLDLTVGRMPNPFFTAGPLVWDPDINPEGFAERLSFALSDNTKLFGTFAQTLYQENNPDSTSNNLGFNSADAYLLGYQIGIEQKFRQEMSLKAAASWYQYEGNGTGAYAGPFTGQPGGNQVGINNLSILDFPVEFNFPVFKLPAKLYGSFAMNLDGDQRARAAGFPNAGNQDKAYLLGFALGTLRKKHDWEARVYWQRIGQYALDPNLVDSDWFDARNNMEGWYLGAGYNITDAVFAAARYGWAKRADSSLGTGGVGDLALNPLDNYQLLQLDLGFRF